MDLSIIIVNWNSSAYLEKCLASVYENTHGIEFEVIVVDNASFDGCGEMLARRFPRVKFIQSQENLGFAGANNLGFEHTTGGALLFLNPDTEVVGDAIPTLFQALRSLPDAGAVGAKLLNSDGSVQTSCIQRFPTIFNQAIDTDFLRTVFPKLPVWGVWPLLEEQGRPVAVDVVSGACIMTRRSLFHQVGRFNTAYFMYSDDVDLCYQYRRHSLKNYYVDAATILHHGGASSNAVGSASSSEVLMKASRLRFFEYRRGPTYAAAYRASVVVTSGIRCALLIAAALLGPRARRWRPVLSRWVSVFLWALGVQVGGASDAAGESALAGGPHR